jgi:hypothetical protein
MRFIQDENGSIWTEAALNEWVCISDIQTLRLIRDKLSELWTRERLTTAYGPLTDMKLVPKYYRTFFTEDCSV